MYRHLIVSERLHLSLKLNLTFLLAVDMTTLKVQQLKSHQELDLNQDWLTIKLTVSLTEYIKGCPASRGVGLVEIKICFNESGPAVYSQPLCDTHFRFMHLSPVHIADLYDQLSANFSELEVAQKLRRPRRRKSAKCTVPMS